MKLYALRHKDYPDSIVGFSYSTTEGEFCSSVSFELCVYAYNWPEDTPWVTINKVIAERVAITNTKWYNSEYENPVNPFVGKLTVIEFGEV